MKNYLDPYSLEDEYESALVELDYTVFIRLNPLITGVLPCSSGGFCFNRTFTAHHNRCDCLLVATMCLRQEAENKKSMKFYIFEPITSLAFLIHMVDVGGEFKTYFK